MAVKDEELRVTVTINGKQGEAALRKLEKENRAYLKSNEDLVAQKKQLEKANQQETAEYKKLTKEIDANNRSIEANTKEMDEHRKTVKLTELTVAELRKEQKRLMAIRDNVKPETEEYRRLNTQIDAVVKRKGELINATKQTGDVVEEMSGNWEHLGQIWQGFSTGHIPTLQSGLRGVAGGIGQVTKSAIAFIATPVGAFLAVLAGIGLVAKEWFEYNDSIKESVILTEQITKLTGEQADAIRLRNQALSETFGTDQKETLEVARNLVEQFGVSYEEALDTIEDGLIKGQANNQEYLDSLREYPVFFAQAGYSLQEFKDIVAAGYDLGIYSDKLPDALKEFDISIREQTKSTREALINAFGKTFTDDLLERINTGKTTTKEALQEIAAESERLGLTIEQNQRLTADVFRGAGEDVGGAIKIFEAISKAASDANRELTPLEQSTRDLANANLELAEAQDAALKSDNFISFSRDLKIFWTDVKTLWYQGVKYVTDLFTTWTDGLVTSFVSVIATAQRVPEIITNGFTNIKTSVVDTIKSVSGLGDVFSRLVKLDFDGAKKAATDFKNNFTSNFNGIKQSASDVVTEILNTQRAAQSLAQDQLNKKRAGNVAAVNSETASNNVGTGNVNDFENIDASDKATQKAVEDAIRRKQAVQAAIDKFDEEQAIRDQLKQFEKDQRAEEEAVLKKELEFQKLTEEAQGDTELLAQLETAKLNEIQAIRDEFAKKRLEKEEAEAKKLEKQAEEARKKQLAAEKKQAEELIKAQEYLESAKQRARQFGVSALAEILGKQNVLVKAAFAFEKAAAIATILKQTTAAVASARAADAAVPAILPPGIPNPAKPVSVATMLANVSAAKINAATQIGSIAAQAIKGFETGKYPVIREQDGKAFNAAFGGQAKTGPVNTPTVFLAGENGQEIIIDSPTVKQLDPAVIKNIYATAARTRGYENGFYPAVNTPQPPTTNQNQAANSQVESMTLQVLSELNAQLQKGIKAIVAYGLEDEIQRQDIEQKLKRTKEASKN